MASVEPNPDRRQALQKQLRAVIAIVARSPGRSAMLALCLGVLVVVGATAYWQIALNAWNEPFYDAINRRDVEGFTRELWSFARIAGVLLVLNVAQMWLNQMMKLKFRESLTCDLVAQWLAPKRAFLLAGAGDIGVNPDQRIHEDARRLTEVSVDLGIGLLQSTLLLVSFIGVLWSLSSGVSFEMSGVRFAAPGYMVWCALLYAGFASLASWRVGRPLVALNAERYARESDLRFALVHVNEHAEGVAVYHGEAQEAAILGRVLDALMINLRRIVGRTTQLTWVVAGYGWFAVVAPAIVAAPAYFSGALTLGGLLMAVGAFTQVQQSLRWFVDNSGLIAEWRAALGRIVDFRSALAEVDRLGAGASRIDFAANADGKLMILDRLRIYTPSGGVALTQPRLEVAPGERVLVVGAPGAGKTTLFRALAGLWPWGEGRIVSAPAGDVMFLPKRPFIPDGALRDSLAYPHARERYSDAEHKEALTDIGLAHLVGALDRSARWDRDLTEVEQQSIAFARVLLQRPRWIVVDAALDILPTKTRRSLFEAIDRLSPPVGVIVISGHDDRDAFFTRTVGLVRNPEERRLDSR